VEVKYTLQNLGPTSPMRLHLVVGALVAQSKTYLCRHSYPRSGKYVEVGCLCGQTNFCSAAFGFVVIVCCLSRGLVGVSDRCEQSSSPGWQLPFWLKGGARRKDLEVVVIFHL
jgi:hypothetical protein